MPLRRRARTPLVWLLWVGFLTNAFAQEGWYAATGESCSDVCVAASLACTESQWTSELDDIQDLLGLQSAFDAVDGGVSCGGLPGTSFSSTDPHYQVSNGACTMRLFGGTYAQKQQDGTATFGHHRPAQR